MQKNNPIEHFKINIIDDETPTFVIQNLSPLVTRNTLTNAMNTVALSFIDDLLFNKNELSILKNRDVFFIKNINKVETVEKDELLEKLVNQAKPNCRVAKIVNLFDFACTNNIDLVEEDIDLFDVLKASKLDEISFRNLLIYFCSFDLGDMQSAVESYALAEVDVEQIHELLHYHSVDSEIIKNTKDL